MERWLGKVAVVTGASSGIGAKIAEVLAQNGLKVVALARRQDKLNELKKGLQGAKGELHPYQCDITNKDETIKAFEWIKTNIGPTSILINNAGVLRAGKPIIEGDFEDWKTVFDTNVLALCLCSREAVKQMKEANIKGHIINVNSVAGHQVTDFPGLNVYPASKFAVTALTQTIQNEIKNADIPIKVTSLSPGLVESEITTDFLKVVNTYLKAIDIANAALYILGTPENVQVEELTISPLNMKFLHKN